MGKREQEYSGLELLIILIGWIFLIWTFLDSL
jgi:hypothetical protein